MHGKKTPNMFLTFQEHEIHRKDGWIFGRPDIKTSLRWRISLQQFVLLGEWLRQGVFPSIIIRSCSLESFPFISDSYPIHIQFIFSSSAVSPSTFTNLRIAQRVRPRQLWPHRYWKTNMALKKLPMCLGGDGVILLR